MRLVPFEPAHADALLEGQLNDDRNRPSPKLGSFAPTLVHEGMAFTAIDNGYLVASGGIAPLWEGVGEAWLLGAERVEKHRRYVARAVHQHMLQVVEKKGLWRVQAAMRSDWPELKRWARFLGMQHEGTMRAYGADGLDYERYARVWQQD